MSDSTPLIVLHYTGATDDRGGIMSVVQALAGAGEFECVLGVSPGFVQRRASLPALELPRIEAEKLGSRTFWRARGVARAARAWLAGDTRRVFHAHSRAGLMVALWLTRAGDRRVVASVHCYGRQRWFYRFASRQLGPRLFWLSPAMKHYYGVATDASWTQCIPGGVPASRASNRLRRRNPDTPVRLGGIGMLVRWKGWHLIVEAIAALPADVRERVRFDHIGGTGGMPDSERYAAELRAATTRFGLDHAITWRGEQATSAPFLSEIDSLVVASQQEPFSIAVLEALAAGVPVLAADSGGAQDVIVEGESGWFFRSGDAASLAAKLELLTRTDALERAKVGMDLVRPFTAPVVAKQWLDVYAGLVC